MAGVLALVLAGWLIGAGSRQAGIVLGLLVLAEGGLGTPSLMEKFSPVFPSCTRAWLRFCLQRR